MRTGKELMAASKQFAVEDPRRSWFELVITILLTVFVLSLTVALSPPLIVKFISGIVCGLLYVRLFVIYHDFQHRAILQRSTLAEWIMGFVGIYLLAPSTIWKRTHEHHHNNNCKLTISGIGSYPTVSTTRFKCLTKMERRIYLINRHSMTILLGYFTLFTYWLNVKSFVQSPAKHIDSLIALLIHWAMGFLSFYYLGVADFIFIWWMPFFVAFGLGSYLFYSQHNFPGAKFRENQDWTYDYAAVASTSFMKMGKVMNWFTADIAYHHVHHLNSRIPFYRLREAMVSMPELDNVTCTSLHPADMIKCFKLKVWDPDRDRMISLKEIQ